MRDRTQDHMFFWRGAKSEYKRLQQIARDRDCSVAAVMRAAVRSYLRKVEYRRQER